jgi:hypothetical protein
MKTLARSFEREVHAVAVWFLEHCAGRTSRYSLFNGVLAAIASDCYQSASFIWSLEAMNSADLGFMTESGRLKCS